MKQQITPKKISFQKVNRNPSRKRGETMKKLSRKHFENKYRSILYDFAWHVRKLKLSVEKVNAKLETSIERLKFVFKRPLELDLDLISRMEALIMRDLIIMPNSYSPNGYFHTSLNQTIRDVDNYLFCTRNNRIIGTPKPDIAKFKASISEAKRAKQAPNQTESPTV